MAGLGGKDSKEGASKKKKSAKKSAAKEKGTKAKMTMAMTTCQRSSRCTLTSKGQKLPQLGGSHSKSAPPPLTIKCSPFFHETN